MCTKQSLLSKLSLGLHFNGSGFFNGYSSWIAFHLEYIQNKWDSLQTWHLECKPLFYSRSICWSPLFNLEVFRKILAPMNINKAVDTGNVLYRRIQATWHLVFSNTIFKVLIPINHNETLFTEDEKNIYIFLLQLIRWNRFPLRSSNKRNVRP